MSTNETTALYALFIVNTVTRRAVRLTPVPLCKRDAESQRSRFTPRRGRKIELRPVESPGARFTIYSAQTGDRFGEVIAADEASALDSFARARGHADRLAMWGANGGGLQYLCARHASFIA